MSLFRNSSGRDPASRPDGPGSAGSVQWWDLESAPEWAKFCRAAYKGGREMREPTKPRIAAPDCFSASIAWVTEMGGSRVEAFHRDHRDLVSFVAGYYHLLHYRGEYESAPVGLEGERVRRQAWADADIARRVRQAMAEYQMDERQLDAELGRLEDAERRLSAAMRGEFVRGWHYRDDVDCVVFPVLDPEKWRYKGRSGISAWDMFSFPTAMPGIGTPPALRVLPGTRTFTHDADRDAETESTGDDR